MNSKNCTDILGQPVEIGDEICMAFPSGSSAEMRIGKVTGITERETERWNYNLQAYFPGPPAYSLVVEWDKDKSPYGVPEKPTKIKETHGRILKIN